MKYFTVEFLKNGLLRFFLKLSYENSATYEHFWVFSHFSVHRWRYFHMTIEEKILKVHFLKNSTVKYFNRNFFWNFRASTLRFHSELFGLFSFGNWKFENLPISILLSIILLFIPYIFIIHSKKNYRLCKTLKKIVLKSGENCFFATFSIFSLVSQGTNLVKTHIVATFCRKY